MPQNPLTYTPSFIETHTEELLIHFCLLNLYTNISKNSSATERASSIKGLRTALSLLTNRWRASVGKNGLSPRTPTLPNRLKLTRS